MGSGLYDFHNLQILRIAYRGTIAFEDIQPQQVIILSVVGVMGFEISDFL